MGHWDDRPASRENLRHFEMPNAWRRYKDEIEAETNETKTHGCATELERILINGLNSTNLLLLTGAGASFCAKNAVGGKTAPGLKDLWDAVKAKVGDPKFTEIIGKIPKGAAIKDIEKLLTQCKLFVALYGDTEGDGKEISEFLARAETAILARADFVNEKTDLTAHEVTLRKIARRGIRKPRAKVFTTNYDLCFEYAAQRQRFIVLDGFSHGAPQVYDRSQFALDIVRRHGTNDAPDYLESVFQLYKLHGSIDWRRTATEIIRARSNEGAPVLIYPRDSKYQEAFEPPYLDMMAALQAALREPDTTLMVAGFSFADSHIAQPILAALESNMNFRLIVCDPVLLPDDRVAGDPVVVTGTDAMQNTFHRRLISLAKTGDERLTLLHGRFEDLAAALPDLVAETERERHAVRVRALREAGSADGKGSAP